MPESIESLLELEVLLDIRVMSRQDFVRMSLGICGAVGLSYIMGTGISQAHADESFISADSIEYMEYLNSLGFDELAAVALAEDGYWGIATTTTWQHWAFHYDSSYTATGNIYHQWQANISSNPGLTSGWNCDSTLAGDDLIRFIQSYSGSGESDGIIGPATISAIQSCLGTTIDGVFSGPSTAIRVMQMNFSRAGCPW